MKAFYSCDYKNASDFEKEVRNQLKGFVLESFNGDSLYFVNETTKEAISIDFERGTYFIEALRCKEDTDKHIFNIEITDDAQMFVSVFDQEIGIVYEMSPDSEISLRIYELL